MKNIFKYISFSSVAALILAMAAATVVEKTSGSGLAVYHHPLFIALWGVAAGSGLAWLLQRGAGRKVFTMLLHVSFALILCGALITHLGAKNGRMTLREGESCSSYELPGGGSAPLPFSLELLDFEVSYYSGSAAASDYSSTVLCHDGEVDTQAVISMNHIFRHRGWRFYQSAYSPDDGSSTLSVSHDPWGIAVTYSGYLLLLVSMIGFFFQKDSRWRSVLRKVAGWSALMPALLLPAGSLSAKEADDTLPVLPEESAGKLGGLYVYYNDRVAPLETMARDYCLKAYGKAHMGNHSATQVLSGWLFWYDWWNVVPFKLKAKDRGTAVEAEKERLRMDVATGAALRIFPLAFPDSMANEGLRPVVWFSCETPLPEDLEYGQWVFIRKSLSLVREEAREGNWEEVDKLLDGIKAYQEKVAGEYLPSRGRVRAEQLYNRISRPMIPFMACITLGLLLFAFYGILLARSRKLPKVPSFVATAVLALLWCYLTLVLGLRWFVSGHAPFAGSYCVMMLMAWLGALGAVLLHRRFPVILPAGLLVCGFTMLVASLASANPQITHLMPVLQSPLLSIHVLCMMISYTLLGLVAMNGIMGLMLPTGEPSARMQELSLLILYPAVFLLTAGTFLGAVWANISWGSYWSWDPKETWALITMLVYAFALHGGSIKAFRRPKFFHAYCIIAFLCVLVTYFGVNLLLGGMHAYA